MTNGNGGGFDDFVRSYPDEQVNSVQPYQQGGNGRPNLPRGDRGNNQPQHNNGKGGADRFSTWYKDYFAFPAPIKMIHANGQKSNAWLFQETGLYWKNSKDNWEEANFYTDDNGEFVKNPSIQVPPPTYSCSVVIRTRTAELGNNRQQNFRHYPDAGIWVKTIDGRNLQELDQFKDQMSKSNAWATDMVAQGYLVSKDEKIEERIIETQIEVPVYRVSNQDAWRFTWLFYFAALSFACAMLSMVVMFIKL